MKQAFIILVFKGLGVSGVVVEVEVQVEADIIAVVVETEVQKTVHCSQRGLNYCYYQKQMALQKMMFKLIDK